MNVTFPGLVPPASKMCQMVTCVFFLEIFNLWGACITQQTLYGSKQLSNESLL